MGVSTRVEVYDPANPEKPIVRLSVPGEVTPRQIRKSIRIGIKLVVDLGDKKKQKTFNLPIHDEELVQRLNQYIDNLEVRLTRVESHEETISAVKMSEIREE